MKRETDLFAFHIATEVIPVENTPKFMTGHYDSAQQVWVGEDGLYAFICVELGNSNTTRPTITTTYNQYGSMPDRKCGTACDPWGFESGAPC